jgi:uncharacterized protein YjbI with pentapeptide repeats
MLQSRSGKSMVVHATAFTQPWAEFTALMVLDLTDCRLNDADFFQLSRLENLRVLNLSGSNISDQTVKHLHRLASISAIYLQQTNLSRRALTRLRKELPGCTVIA